MSITQQYSSFSGEPKHLAPLTLAFIGDGVFELLVRSHLLDEYSTLPPKKLHRMAVERVNATAQAEAYNLLIGQLNAEESDILRRGRNANINRVPKNSSVEDYHKSTALEALFGYLYLSNEQERIQELFNLILKEIHTDK